MGTGYVDLGEHTCTLGMNEYGDRVCRKDAKIHTHLVIANMGTWYVDLGEHTCTLGMSEYGDMVCR